MLLSEGKPIRATAVCSRLSRETDERRRDGEVHSVFRHAINLAVDGSEGLVGLLTEEKGLTPYALSLRVRSPLDELGVRAGMTASLRGTVAEVPAAGLTIDFTAAERIDLRIDSLPLRRTGNARGKADALNAALEDADADYGVGPLATCKGENVVTAFLRPRVEELFRAVASGDAERAARAAERAAGCGAGLTPSSDDFLTGYFATLYALCRLGGRAEGFRLIRMAALAAAAKTNRISATFLLQSGEGLVQTDVRTLLRTIFSSEDGEAAYKAARNVLSIGSTSGGDMLAGISLALTHHAGGN